MTKIEYDKRDTMPVEVATRMLLEPRARISAPMRRECRAARMKTITSPTPIRRAAFGYETDEAQKRRPYADKCARKAAQLGMAKLVQLQATTAKRRLAVQRPFAKAQEELDRMQAQTEPADIVRNARRYSFVIEYLKRLTDEANRLDTILDVVTTEMEKRCLNSKSPEFSKKWLQN